MMHLFILKGMSYQCITQLSIDQFTLWFFVTERREFTADNFDHSDDLPRGFFPIFWPCINITPLLPSFSEILMVFPKNKNTSHHKRYNLPQLRALRALRASRIAPLEAVWWSFRICGWQLTAWLISWSVRGWPVATCMASWTRTGAGCVWWDWWFQVFSDVQSVSNPKNILQIDYFYVLGISWNMLKPSTR